MFRKILLHYDGSERGRETWERCLPLLTRSQDEVAILAVIRPSEFALDVVAQTVMDIASEEIARQRALLQHSLNPLAAPMTTHARWGVHRIDFRIVRLDLSTSGILRL